MRKDKSLNCMMRQVDSNHRINSFEKIIEESENPSQKNR